MTQWKSLSGTTALLLVLTGAAQADVTGADVWNNWKTVATGAGQMMTSGSETQAGDTLTIRDLKMSMDTPEMTMSSEIAMIAFRDRGDGTVEVTMSPSYNMQIDGAPEGGESVKAVVQIDQPDATVIASGGDGTVSYDIAAPKVSISLVSLTVNGAPIEATVEVLVSDIAGLYKMTEGEMSMVTSTLDAGLVTINVDAKEPGGEGSFKASADFADVAMTSDGSMMMMGAMDDFPALLAAGFSTAGAFSHGAATYAMDFQDSADNFTLNGSADSGSLALSLDADAISYETGTTGLSLTISGSDIPLPEIAASIAEFGTSFLMPLSQSDAPQDFGASLTLDGLSVSDMIWGLADPSGSLPHDPATLIVNVTGSGNWLIDIMDPEATAALEDQMPGEIHSLDLNELKLAVAGAVLTGMGGFTFDNSDLETFEGLPAPTGEIDLTLVGGNGLLDKLVAMGLLPEEQAMGARMMMGMFARPGGEDTLTSKIEVKGDGSISANGQRLQ